MNIISLHSEVQQGGFRKMKIARDFISCPAMGWGDRPYMVNMGLKTGSFYILRFLLKQLNNGDLLGELSRGQHRRRAR